MGSRCGGDLIVKFVGELQQQSLFVPGGHFSPSMLFDQMLDLKGSRHRLRDIL